MARPLTETEIRAIHRSLPSLRYDDRGTLRFEGHSLRALAEHTGTPMLALSLPRIEDNYASVRDAFAARFPGARVFYALKAGYVRDCVETLLGLGAGIEVMSDLELQVALQLGCPPDRIVANGVGRDDLYLERSNRLALALNVVDGMEDLGRFQRLADELGTTFEVGLRISPTVTGPGVVADESTKLGSAWHDGSFAALLEAALSTSRLEVKGLHVHQLVHADSPRSYRSLVDQVAEAIVEIERHHGHRFEVVDLGGGFETRVLMEASGHTIDDFADAAFGALERVPYEFVLFVEPGRYVLADAGVAVSSVLTEKDARPTPWRIADISTNFLIPLPDIAYYPIPTQLPEERGWHAYHLGDRVLAPVSLCRDVVLPEGPEGRQLALLNAGAYTTVFGELWAFPLPSIVMLEQDSARVLFDRDDYCRLVRSVYGYDVEMGRVAADPVVGRPPMR